MGSSYVIAGDGRLAFHLKHYFDSLGFPYQSWSRERASQDPLRSAEILEKANVILVMLQDAAIEPWIENKKKLYPSSHGKEKVFIHFSGSLDLESATGFHPLMTFSETLYDLETYKKIPFVCDAEGVRFGDIFPNLPNPSFTLARNQKARYHSLCVLSGNFSVLLWHKFFSELEHRYGIPPEVSKLYMQRVDANLCQDYERALTGPLQRGDVETLERDMKALKGDAFEPIFKAFVDNFLAPQGVLLNEHS